jgi:hypothetical protein
MPHDPFLERLTKMKVWVLKLSLILLLASSTFADQWPQTNILYRVVFVRTKSLSGTAFTIERNGKQYLITARHLVKGLPPKDAQIEVLVNGSWTTLKGNIILPKNEEEDVAAFTLSHDLTVKFDIGVTTLIAPGQTGYFLGYPHGWYTNASGVRLPFVKRLSLSAVAETKNGTVFYYFDGFNNPGFSGGPITFYNSQTSMWDIVAVVSGFEPEAAKKLVGKEYVDTTTFVNSGVIVGYPLQPALDAIDDYMKKTP